MTGPQFLEWMAYSELEPFGEERADLRLAAVLRLIFAVNRDPKRSPDVPSVGAFYRSFVADVQEYTGAYKEEKPPTTAKRQTWQEQKAILLEYAMRQAVAHEAEARREARATARNLVVQ